VRSAPVRYTERLWPSVGVWLVVLMVAASGGLVVVKVASGWVSGAVALACVAAATWGLVRSSAAIVVTGDELVAGRARIPVKLLGEVHVLDRTDFAALRGPRADMRAYLCQRGWIPRGVRVGIADPQDPTPYWLLSSRHPTELAAALERARGERGEASGQAHSRQTG
jgi:Protein of unknown function (DUF3093)